MNLKETVIGLELGSTRIKAVLIDKNHSTLATGSYTWENKLENGIWTYPLDAVDEGLKVCFGELKKDFKQKFNKPLTTVGAMGISGMMHGYIPVDAEGNVLTQFRTWRNTITGEAAEKLTSLFDFNIPQRWSIAHLYQAILNKESHIPALRNLMTLSVYVNWKLTGEKVIGIGEASGMFPIDSTTLDYDADMAEKFDVLLKENGINLKTVDILPKVLPAGVIGGTLTKEGALLLDPDGELQAGIPLTAPEGDAGTGMVATNSVKAGTGNVSAGTSNFAMIVLENKIGMHKEIDMVTTPAGKSVAMVHCNNCTSDINAWVELFYEFAKSIGADIDMGNLYSLLFNKATEGDADCGGLLSFNYLSGEGITDLDEGRPLFMREQNAKFNLANFMRTHLMSALATLYIGMDILYAENVTINKIFGHGGYFKTAVVGQTILSACMKCPVSVMETAGEGGPYGMALLAAYMLWKKDGEELEDYLENNVFAGAKIQTLMADENDINGFESFAKAYKQALSVEKEAIKKLK